MSNDNDTFTRIFELESRDNAVTLDQQRNGDVSCVVWDASLVLAKYLDISCRENRLGRDWLRGKNVVELGAGVGCVGITAACLGAHVTMTDLEASIPMLQRNIDINENEWKKNGGTACCKILDWGETKFTDIAPDILLLADCVYYMESIEPLLKTMELLCSRNSKCYALMSQEERDTPGQIPIWREFMIKLRDKFEIERIPLDQQDSTYSSQDINLLKLSLIK